MTTQQKTRINDLIAAQATLPLGGIAMAGVTCLLLMMIASTAQLQLGLAVGGAVLMGIGGVIWLLRRWRAYLVHSQLSCATQVIAHDLVAGFVTDRGGFLFASNAAAQKRFGTVNGQALSDVFADVLANPKAIFTQLLAQAAADGAGSEDILTRSGHFRIRVVLMGPDCHLWWLDDLSGAVASHPRQIESVLAKATLSTGGNLIRRNAAFRRLIPDDKPDLEAVFADLPLRTGHLHQLRHSQEADRVVVAQVQAAHDEIDLYLLPAKDNAPTVPELEVGWDAIEDLPVPLLKIGQDGALIGCNREARQLLSIETTENCRLSDVLDGPGRHINDWLSEAIQGHGGHVSQFLRGRGKKTDTFVQVTLRTSGKDGDVHLIAVLNDVTELKTLEAQFVQSQKMQAIGQLAGGVAHDFNNLLTAISGHCDLLLLRHDEGDQNYGDLIQIHQNANRAASLVGQLLAFSRKQNLQLEAIDLRHTLSDLTHLLNRLVGEKITLTLDHASDLAQIRADKRQLEQVLMNLVVNARDAMQAAGEIKIVTKNLHLDSEMRKERVSVPAGSYVMVKVIDTGSGITADKLPKIFEPFYTTKRTGEGTGLGLSTAYGIVKQTGGYIFAESKIGEGTIFSLLFPCFSPSTAPVLKNAKAPSQVSKQKADGVILLVEDEAPVRAFASRALQLKGYTVLEADCAETALAMLEDQDLHVDLFVTDVIMPGLDGPTWVRQALLGRPDTKVVFVSGYPEDAFEDGEPEIAGAVFLPKPFSLTALTQTVGEQLVEDAVLETA